MTKLLRFAVLPALALGALACTPAKPSAPQLLSSAFPCTGGPQTFAVPAGVTFVGVDVYGAQGGDGLMVVAEPGEGGLGGRASVGLPVAPGQSLQVNVGCEGTTPAGDPGGAGGFAGGGEGGEGNSGGGGGGGGASDVRQGGTALANRVVVAAGGGGGGCGTLVSGGDGGAGGHPNGGGGEGPGAGSGGTQTEGGQGAIPGPQDGDLGTGGPGGDSLAGGGGGGGAGGGGFYGGAGGNGAAAGVMPSGGSGGSSFGDPGATFQNGVQPGDGLVIIYWYA